MLCPDSNVRLHDVLSQATPEVEPFLVQSLFKFQFSRNWIFFFSQFNSQIKYQKSFKVFYCACGCMTFKMSLSLIAILHKGRTHFIQQCDTLSFVPHTAFNQPHKAAGLLRFPSLEFCRCKTFYINHFFSQPNHSNSKSDWSILKINATCPSGLSG